MAAELEPPFVPREKLIEKQKYYQAVKKHTYLKGPMDMITSVAIPLAFAGASLFMILAFKADTISRDTRCIGRNLTLVATLSDQVVLTVVFLSVVASQGRGIYNMSHGIGKKE